MELKITLERLERLMNEQKRLVIDHLLEHSGSYNTESDAGHYKTLPIDKEKFTKQGMSAKFPSDIYVLKTYVK